MIGLRFVSSLTLYLRLRVSRFLRCSPPLSPLFLLSHTDYSSNHAGVQVLPGRGDYYNFYYYYISSLALAYAIIGHCSSLDSTHLPLRTWTFLIMNHLYRTSYFQVGANTHTLLLTSLLFLVSIDTFVEVVVWNIRIMMNVLVTFYVLLAMGWVVDDVRLLLLAVG